MHHILSKLLKKAKIPHNILNAKHHEREAEIVENAGQKGALLVFITQLDSLMTSQIASFG